MISFDCLTLTALVEELREILIGGRVHKVQQPEKHVILITFRAQGKNPKLCISAHPKYSYIALLNHSKRVFINPEKPPMFCMLLRKHMEGAKIVDIKQPPDERILEIVFESFNELGDRMKMTVACEIMGKYSNVILYVTETKLILGCAHNVGELMSSQRELAGSLPYVLPPAQNKRSLMTVSKGQFLNMSLALTSTVDVWLSQTFHNISLALAKELCHTAGVSIEALSLNKQENLGSLYDLTRKLLSEQQFKPSLSRDKELFSLLATDPNCVWQGVSSVNEMVDRYFAYHINKDSIKQTRANLKSRINREIKRITTRKSKLDKIIDKAHDADKYRITGDILTANLHRIQPGLKEVELENFYDDNNFVKIDLDQRLTPNQNAQKYYKIYNKAKNSLQITLDIRKTEEDELKYLEGILVNIEQASDIATLEQIQDEINTQLKSQKTREIISKKNKDKKPQIEITTFVSSDNLEILVGRNNKQNDYLISKLAHPSDLWLHTQIAHGSHVIIKTDRGTLEIPEKTLHEAALLAGYYSEGRYSSSVSIIYTLKKFVKKPAGAKPGYVIYSNEKTLYVNPLEEHMAPILDKIQQ